VQDPTAVVYDINMWNQLVSDTSGFTKFQKALGTLDKSTFEGAAILTWTTAATGSPVPGEALLVDMGEPGRSDFFEIASINTDGTLASIAGGFLAGGNVQMHGRCV
jgi:hypothetical protein